jgi:DNA polymerase-3 subunit delta
VEILSLCGFPIRGIRSKKHLSMLKSAKSAASCFFVTGSDEAGIKKQARAMCGELAPGADAFGLEVVDGGVESVEAAVARIEETIGALLTIPFMGSGKLVWLKNASFLSDTPTGRSESVLAALERLAVVLREGLPDGNRFLLSAIAPDKRRTTYRTLAKLCETTVVDLPDLGFRGGEEALVEWVARKAAERGLQLEPPGLEVLTARVGLDAPQLESELDKLETAFGKSARIPAESVRMLVPQTREGGIFDLSGAILRRDLPQALETLAQLFRQGEGGVGILLAAVAPTVRNLLLIHDLMQRHRIPAGGYANQFASALAKLPTDETAHLPRKKDGSLNAYPLSLAASHASNFSRGELVSGLRGCAEAGARLFSSGLGDEVILARFLVGFLGRA